MQSTVFLLKITENSKLVANRLLSKLLIFLIIDFKILGHVEKKKFFQRTPFSKASVFDTFTHAQDISSVIATNKLKTKVVKNIQ